MAMPSSYWRREGVRIEVAADAVRRLTDELKREQYPMRYLTYVADETDNATGGVTACPAPDPEYDDPEYDYDRDERRRQAYLRHHGRQMRIGLLQQERINRFMGTADDDDDPDLLTFELPPRNTLPTCGCNYPDGRCVGHKAGSVKPACSTTHCYCGKSRTQCEWFKARDFRENKTTDSAVIAQQLWVESRDLLAKVGVELPASPPAPVRVPRWHQRPIVRRVALGMVWALSALFAGFLFGMGLTLAPVTAFLVGVFFQYDMIARTPLKWRHIANRLIAIVAFGYLLAWLL